MLVYTIYIYIYIHSANVQQIKLIRTHLANIVQIFVWLQEMFWCGLALPFRCTGFHGFRLALIINLILRHRLCQSIRACLHIFPHLLRLLNDNIIRIKCVRETGDKLYSFCPACIYQYRTRRHHHQCQLSTAYSWHMHALTHTPTLISYAYLPLHVCVLVLQVNPRYFRWIWKPTLELISLSFNDANAFY